MSMDLSFWEPPNWKKEAKINPLFWAFIFIFVIVGGLGIGAGYLWGELDSVTKELSKYEESASRLSANHNTILAKRKLYQTVDKGILAQLRERARRRPVLSKALVKLYGMVNDDIVFGGLSLSGVEVKPKKGKGGPVKKMKYLLTLRGTVFGVGSQAKLNEFAGLFKDNEKGFGEQMTSSEVVQSDSSGENSNVAQTKFTIKSEFKEK